MDVGKSAQAADGFKVVNRVMKDVGNEYPMQNQTEVFTAQGAAFTNYMWTTYDPAAPTPDPDGNIPSTTGTPAFVFNSATNGPQVTIKANSLGSLGLTLTAWNGVGAEGKRIGEISVSFLVRVESIILAPLEVKKDGKRVGFTDFPSKTKSEKMALFLNQGVDLSIDDKSQTNEQDVTKIRLLYASGQGDSKYTMRWSSDNPDVLSYNDTTYKVKAEGVGHTKLNVSIIETATNTETEKHSLDVYVSPQMAIGKKSNQTMSSSELESAGTVDLKNGQYVSIQNLKEDAVPAGAERKIDWVVYEEVAGSYKMVSEYYYNGGRVFHTGKDYDENDANFRTYDSAETAQAYEFHGRPGIYHVIFLPSGIYSNDEENPEIKDIIEDMAQGIGFRFTIKVASKWEDHEVTLNVGGSYDLVDAMGISAEAFKKEFTITKITDESQSNGHGITEPSYIVEKSSERDSLLRADKGTEGKAVYKVTHTDRDASLPALYGVPDPVDKTLTPGTEAYNKDVERASIYITIYVKETFHLNYSSIQLFTGKTYTRLFKSEFGTGAPPTGSKFRWDCTSSDGSLNWKDYLTLPEGYDKNSDEDVLETLTVGNKTTPRGKTLKLTLYWTYEGITQTASCEIEIVETATKVTITDPAEHNPIKMEPGDTMNVRISTTGGSPKTIRWISSNEEVFKIHDGEDEVQYDNERTIEAVKPGRATLVLLNGDNPAIMETCEVVVVQRITGIKITGDKNLKSTGEGTAEVSLGAGYVQLYADLEPKDATETDVIWSIKDSVPGGIATIDAKTGKLTFNGLEGKVIVQAEPADNSQRDAGKRIDAATLEISIKATPVTALSVAESEIWVIRGQTREIEYTITPKDAYDAENIVVKAGDDGKFATAAIDHDKFLVKITGVAATAVNSLTTVTVSCSTLGTKVEPVTIKVHVTEPLTSIAFDQEEYTVQVGKTIDVGLIYAPSENVDKSNVKMVTENPKIATLTEKLENAVVIGASVTGVSVGDVTIHVMATELGIDGMKSCVVHVIEPIVVAGDFAVDPEKKTIKEGETFEIMPIFTPANPTDQTVEYTSSDESVATVSPDGIVKGVAVSEVPVMITCTYVPTGKVAICMVTVESRVKLKLNPTKKTIVKGRSFTITKTITPSKFKNTPVQWKSSNSKIATVSQAGKVKTKKTGTCIITCYLVNYNVKATCTVKVTKVKTTLKLNKSSIRINIGQTYKLKSTVTSNDTVKPSVRYTSRNKKIASVGSKTGKIKGKKVGSTVITARTTDSARATARCRVTVIRRATSLDLNKHYAICYIGGTIKLKAAVKPNTTTIKKLQWSTSDNTIASVDQNGKVSGLMEGDIYITVKTTDGSNLSDRCYVRVMDAIPASSITIAQTKLTMKKGDTADLTYQLLPTNTTDTVTMATDNKRVARVTDDGRITAVGTGAATITIMTTSGTTTTVEVHVVDLNKSSLRIRQYDTETLLVTGADETVTWYSENNRIASVENGTVTGRGVGTTYVYAYIDGCKLSCRVQIVSVNNMQR